MLDCWTIGAIGMSKKILVVDDSGTERLYISELIGKTGDAIGDGASGIAEAKEKLGREKYDLILIDAYMPEGSGIILKKYISQENPCGNGDTHVIVMGHESDFKGDYLRENSFTNYLEKPIAFNMLKAAIALYA